MTEDGVKWDKIEGRSGTCPTSPLTSFLLLTDSVPRVAYICLGMLCVLIEVYQHFCHDSLFHFSLIGMPRTYKRKTDEGLLPHH